MRKLVLAAAGAAAISLSACGFLGHEEGPPLPKISWSFFGVFGTFDKAELQRGFQVYTEVCANCHSLALVAYRDLKELGFSEEEVKAIAASHQVADGPNDEGEMYQRPGRPSDRFVKPFPNDMAARAANNGALPPDQSLIAKSREGGPTYAYALLTGYKATPPAGVTLGQGMYYNDYFPGHQIAMPPPLSEGQVTFSDNTPSTVENEARAVAAFLEWAAEPNLEARHRTGFKVILFLLGMTGLLYLVKRKIWKDIH